MNYEAVINEFLNDSKISLLLDFLKSDNWAKLSEKEKKDFFISFNGAFCNYLNSEEIKLSFSGLGINASDMIKSKYYNNVIENDDGELIINDINYNQYLTLYEYLIKVREKFQNTVCFGNFKGDVDEELKKKWKDNLRKENLGDIEIYFYINEGDLFYEYQDLTLDASEFAEKIVMNIVRKNYNESNSKDEQYFFSSDKILVNKNIVDIGKEKISKINDSKTKSLSKLLLIKLKLAKLPYVDLENVDDGDLFMMIYPSIASEIEPVLLGQIYNEIASRLSDISLKMEFNKNSVIFNGNVYPYRYFKKNHFNVFLYEVLRECDAKVRKNVTHVSNKEYEERIVSYKKKFLYKLLNDIDSVINKEGLDVINYQPLSKLVNVEYLFSNLLDSANGNVPLKKRGK